MIWALMLVLAIGVTSLIILISVPMAVWPRDATSHGKTQQQIVHVLQEDVGIVCTAGNTHHTVDNPHGGCCDL